MTTQPNAHPGVAFCPHCESTHGVRFLCDPAAALLNALRERGAKYDMPTVEFDEPVIETAKGDAVLVAGVTAKAVFIPVHDVAHPAVLLYPVGVNDRPLTPLLYVGSTEDVTRLGELVRDVADMAVRAARKANGGSDT